ncbi:MAG: PadR family transcriptional regulator [Clostridia bacterium]|nr:PadR family transcriptional regulator [Clostridia bacterium]
MDAQLKKGLLDVCVLKVLEQGESYGYKIISDLEQVIPVSESTLYPILKRLETSGYVVTTPKEHNGRLRKYFTITQAGRRKIKTFLEDSEEFTRIMRFLTEEL